MVNIHQGGVNCGRNYIPTPLGNWLAFRLISSIQSYEILGGGTRQVKLTAPNSTPYFYDYGVCDLEENYQTFLMAELLLVWL